MPLLIPTTPRRFHAGVAFGLCVILLTAHSSQLFAAESEAGQHSPQYAELQRRLARGWNTWDTNSVMTYVLLPEGLAIRIGIIHQSTSGANSFLSSALMNDQGKNDVQVVPGPHSYDGSYTELKLLWHGHSIRIQSAHDGSDMVLLATPLPSTPASHLPAELVLSAGMLWNRPGSVVKQANQLRAQLPGRTFDIFLSGFDTGDVNVPVMGPYFSANLNALVGLSTGKARTVAEIQNVLKRERLAYDRSVAAWRTNAGIADAIQSVIGWNTIYEPEGRRVITPVSGMWSVKRGGYVLFGWDTFFAASLAAIGDRDLAYANAIEILREETPEGFVPNYARSGGWKSFDRSEPPVGAFTVLQLYTKFHDRWFLQETFEPLLRWNRWWATHRDRQGYLVWGSDGQNQPVNLDDKSVGNRVGAIRESGLDNSPMYDDATYDEETHQLAYADVGLMGMYIADCDALVTIAHILGRAAEAEEIQRRAGKYRTSLATLWDDKSGIFLNKDLETEKFSHRLSPTNFYPMFARAATPEQARRMVDEHLLNQKEFWGQWVIPSIARDDSAFKEQNYWRGRIWGPMNYLVYLGMRNYHQPDIDRARQELSQKSADLFLMDWRATGYSFENYNALTGSGDNSTREYHWGALLGLIALEEQEDTAKSQ